jgi:hypothetical protein
MEAIFLFVVSQLQMVFSSRAQSEVGRVESVPFELWANAPCV